MILNSSIRLDHLTLTNFRCFEECSLGLHGKLTVLVAENGRGKTALLDAIGIALGLFVDTLAETTQYHGFDRTDVRLVREDARKTMIHMLPTNFLADGFIEGQPVRWSRTLKSDGKRARTNTSNAKSLREAASQLRERVCATSPGKEIAPTVLPLIAYYRTGRLWSEHRRTGGMKIPSRIATGRMSGYLNCLSSSSSFKGFTAWYEAQMVAAGDPKSTALPIHLRPEKLVSTVREATRVVLKPTGWHELNWDVLRKIMVVEHTDQGSLPLSVLSDGIRNMIALVADIAYRCVILNPHLGEFAAMRTPGVLLIDEVDMHLHPRWQQLVIALLQDAFPGLQMIVTTHSPHVLSTVEMSSIRIIRLMDGKGMLSTPTMQTRGVESADVLASIMAVDPVPQIQEARWLNDYRALIESGQVGEADARGLRHKLVAHFGDDHPLILDCDRLIRFQALRISRMKAEVD